MRGGWGRGRDSSWSRSIGARLPLIPRASANADETYASDMVPALSTLLRRWGWGCERFASGGSPSRSERRSRPRQATPLACAPSTATQRLLHTITPHLGDRGGHPGVHVVARRR